MLRALYPCPQMGGGGGGEERRKVWGVETRGAGRTRRRLRRRGCQGGRERWECHRQRRILCSDPDAVMRRRHYRQLNLKIGYKHQPSDGTQ